MLPVTFLASNLYGRTSVRETARRSGDGSKRLLMQRSVCLASFGKCNKAGNSGDRQSGPHDKLEIDENQFSLIQDATRHSGRCSKVLAATVVPPQRHELGGLAPCLLFRAALGLERPRYSCSLPSRARARRAAATTVIDLLDLLAPAVWRCASGRRRHLHFSLAPACADPRGMKRFQRVVGTEVGFSVGAREPVF